MLRPMRSWMFVPGNVRRFLDKAASSDADVVLLDLEDGVLPPAKPEARRRVSHTLAREWNGPLRFVRVNAVGTPWFEEDMSAVLVPGLEGVCLPKADGPDVVAEVAERLYDFEVEHDLESGTVRIVAAIESARGLLNACEIAKCDRRVSALIFGAEDLALDLGLGTQRKGEAAELLHARSSLVVSAAAARVMSIDGVFPDLHDADGLLADVVRARRLGFTGKSTFNPRQIGVIHKIFSPQEDELVYARNVMAAFDEAQLRGEASVAVGGQLVDLPIVLRAQRLLALTEEFDEKEK